MTKKKKGFSPTNTLSLLSRIAEEGLSSPDFTSLIMLEKAKRDYPDTYNVLFSYMILQQDGWITEDFQYTEKAITFLLEIEGLFRKASKVKESFPLDKAAEYNSIFPERTKIPTSNKWARDDDRSVAETLLKFTKLFPQYEWDTILTATEQYVQEKERDDYNYMRTSKYFIMKRLQDGSHVYDLATYCQQVMEGEEKPQDRNRFDEKVV